MLIAERQRVVLQALRDRGSVQLDELARELGVSTATVRRDLDTLVGKGVAERTHGGAIYLGEAGVAGGASANVGSAAIPAIAGSSLALATRMGEEVRAKQQIGKLAASMVLPQMTVLMDGGSTVFIAAQQITSRPIQVVTSSLPIANLFSEDDAVEVVLIGGTLYPRTGVTVGPIASGCLADLHADMLLFSVAGVYGEEAFNQNLAMAQVEQTMMRQAARSVMLMDATKFGRKSLARVCALSEVDTIVTDARIAGEWRERLGKSLVIAPE